MQISGDGCQPDGYPWQSSKRLELRARELQHGRGRTIGAQHSRTRRTRIRVGYGKGATRHEAPLKGDKRDSLARVHLGPSASIIVVSP